MLSGLGREPLGVGYVRADEPGKHPLVAPRHPAVGHGSPSEAERLRRLRSRRASAAGSSRCRTTGSDARWDSLHRSTGQQMLTQLPEHLAEDAGLHPLPEHLHGGHIVPGRQRTPMKPLNLRLP